MFYRNGESLEGNAFVVAQEEEYELKHTFLLYVPTEIKQ